MGKLILFIHHRGTIIRAEGDTLKVFIPGKGPKNYPFKRVEELWIMEGVSLTSDVIIRASRYGTAILFVPRSYATPSILQHGKFFPMPTTRVEQVKALLDDRGVILAKAFAYASAHSRYMALKYLALNRRKTNPEIAEILDRKAEEIKEYEERIASSIGNLDEVRDTIRAQEGNTARIYYEALTKIVPEELWPTKERKYFPPPDPFNALISFANSIVRGVVFRMVLAAGLDPTIGFMHKLRSGNRAMVHDLSELFIVPIAHMSVLKLVTAKKVNQDDWRRIEGGGIYLSDTGRRKVFSEINKALDKKLYYKGKRRKIRLIILHEARKIAKYLRGQIRTYKPFIPPM